MRKIRKFNPTLGNKLRRRQKKATERIKEMNQRPIRPSSPFITPRWPDAGILHLD
jgi:hypothetical protein